MYGACIATIVALSLVSCLGGEEEIIPENKPDDSEVKGDVTFTLETTGATGSGTAASPIVVEAGGRLNMTISQENRYTDPDGTLHTCKPVATIKLHAETDTVVAHDLQALLAVAGTPDTKSTSEGSNPQRNQTTQTFTIGGQQVVFDLSHEVYSIANAAAKAVELPYLKPGEAKFGSSDAAQTRAAASLSAISVRPLGLTRAETITCNPKAQVVLTAAKDTVWADKTETLEQKGILSEPTLTAAGENPTENTKGYTYVVNGQTLTFDLGWQSSLIVADADTHEPLTMPSVRFGELSVKSVTVQELETKEVETLARYHTLYNVTTTFTLELISEGIGEEKREEVDLVVTTLAATEVKLVRVTYKRDWEWVEPHGNMALFYYAKVHRTRHYSNGESYTDTFMDGGHMADMGLTLHDKEGHRRVWSDYDLSLVIGSQNEVDLGDSIWVKSRTSILTGDPTIDFSFDKNPWDYTEEGYTIGHWKNYTSFGRYYDNQTLNLADDVIVEGEIYAPIPDSLQDRRSGWYVHKTNIVHSVRYTFAIVSVAAFMVNDSRYDQYLLLDGYMFTFIDKDLRPDPIFRDWSETIPGGWVFGTELKMQYLGRNFSATAIDTVLFNPSTPLRLLYERKQNDIRKKGRSLLKSLARERRGFFKLSYGIVGMIRTIRVPL